MKELISVKNDFYALITGGSSGLGKELLLQCASLGWNVIIIDLSVGSAQHFVKQIETEYGIKVVFFEFDITNESLLAEKLKYITDNYKVNFLINNAGIGGTAEIMDTSFDYMESILKLNVNATASITRRMLNHLMIHKQSYIMNIASMAAFTPIAYKTVYPASKAFISSFSLGLREELRKTGISISVVYPAAIMTNSHVSQRIISLGRKGKIGLLPIAEVARIALKQTLLKKGVIIPGLWNKINYILMNLLPLETRLKIVSRTIKSELNSKN